MNNIIDCVSFADKIKNEVRDEIRDNGYNIKFCIVTVGDDPASKVYVNNKKKACSYCLIDVHQEICKEEITTEELIELITELNKIYDCIMVQLPVPKHIDESRVLNSIEYMKDVDGLTIMNNGFLHTGNPLIKPATAYGVVELLKYELGDLTGKRVSVVGRSNIVGRPVARLLEMEGCTVTTLHSKTKNVIGTLNSLMDEIVILAVGKPKFISMLHHRPIVIDVGINRDNDGKLCGDFVPNEENNKSHTPVPKGIGPITVAFLMKNILESYKIQKGDLIK